MALPMARWPRRRLVEAAWSALLFDCLHLHDSSTYERLSRTASPHDEVIRRDLDRTLPSEELFREKDGPGQCALFRILRALSVQLWDIGYTQSMNFVVATLINMFPDDEVFVFSCAQALLFRHEVSGFYKSGFPKLGVTLWQFERIVEAFLPQVHSAIEQTGITADFYATQWFLTLFASDLQQAVVCRIWDRFLVSGWRVFVQVGLALLHEVQDEIKELDPCELMVFLKRFTRTKRFDAEELLRVATTFEVSHQMLSELEAAYVHGGADHAKLILECETGNCRPSWYVQRRGKSIKSCEPDSCGTMLGFLIHNLDSGSTAVMEEAWDEYVRELHTANCVVVPMTALNRSGSRKGASSKPSTQSCAKSFRACSQRTRVCADGGAFWLQGRQQQALRALGKA